MDEETKKFLIEGEFEEYIEHFTANRVDMVTIYGLAKEDIDETLIRPYGDRFRFKKYLTKHVAANNVVKSPLYVVPRTASSDTLELDSSSSFTFSDMDLPNESTPCSTPKRLKICSVPDDSATSSGFETYPDLKAHFKSQSMCAAIIERADADEDFMLSDREQGVIVGGAIEYANTKCDKEMKTYKPYVLEKLANTIKKLFPNESKVTYYRPPLYNEFGRQSQRVGGKLMEKVYNLNKSKAHDKGLSSSQGKGATVRQKVCNKKGFPLSLDCEDDEQTFLENKKFLLENDKPWNIVETKWRKTSKRRLLQAYGSENSACDNRVIEYFAEWPLIQHSLGYSLLEIDFNTLYPATEDNKFLIHWDLFKLKLKTLMKHKIKHKVSKKVLEPFLKNATVEGEDGILMSHLSHLFQSRSLIKSDKSYWRPTIAETSSSFVTLVPNVSSVDDSIKARKKRLITLQENIQPFVIVVGESMCKIEKCFVCMDDIKYEKEGILEAVDTCFKAIHATGAMYDRASESIWLFLQLMYYQIHTPYDNLHERKSSFANVQHVKRTLECINTVSLGD